MKIQRLVSNERTGGSARAPNGRGTRKSEGRPVVAAAVAGWYMLVCGRGRKRQRDIVERLSREGEVAAVVDRVGRRHVGRATRGERADRGGRRRGGGGFVGAAAKRLRRLVGGGIVVRDVPAEAAGTPDGLRTVNRDTLRKNVRTDEKQQQTDHPNPAREGRSTVTCLLEPGAVRYVRATSSGRRSRTNLSLSFLPASSCTTMLNLRQKSSPFSPRLGSSVSSLPPRMIGVELLAKRTFSGKLSF